MLCSKLFVRSCALSVLVWFLHSVNGSLADEKPYGLTKRTAWTNSKIKGSPDPPSPYRTVGAFPKLKFDEPLDATFAPGLDRMFVVERYGKIYSFPNDPRAESADLFLDMKKVVYGLAFHPEFAKNGFCYVTYLVHTEEHPEGTRVARFNASGNPPRVDPTSEKVLITWPSGGHNGGCLKFGPDGYLYIATGDSSGIADEYRTGQDLTNLSGAILRIDVDRQSAGKPYTIPADNPFTKVPDARGEIWAYGLRQPWKIAFDRKTGKLWTGNIGQDLWEAVLQIERGGNYGWSVLEGSHPFGPDRPRGPTPFIEPIFEHHHVECRSITGGYVYHGSRIPKLRGAYIYGDYDSGKIWMLRYDPKKKEVTEHGELVDSSLRLVGFTEDHDNELFLVDHISGRISKLEENPVVDDGSSFPRRLSETGLFASVAKHVPAPGVIPYSVIAPQWCDGASKQRLLALPGESQIVFDGTVYPQPAPGAPHSWKLPDGTVTVETLSMELETGNPRSRRRLETRILHYEELEGSDAVGAQFWRGYTYLWNDDQTDAVLLEDPRGLDRKLTIQDATAPGGKRTQTWHFPSRTECIVCHNMAAKYALGMNTLQLNRDHDYGGTIANQLRTFEHIGLFTEPLPRSPDKLEKLVDYHDKDAPVSQRARSYLHANCSHCHRKWGGGNSDVNLLATLTMEDMKIAGVRPAHGGFHIPNAQLLAPGQPFQSVMLYRTSKLGPGRMPRIGSSVVDSAGVQLLHDWISSYADGQIKRPAEELLLSEAFKKLENAGSAQGSNSVIDQILESTQGALRLAYALNDGANQELPTSVRAEVITKAAKHPDARVRDLFERYLPEEQRTQRLGNVVVPEKILAMAGDIERGRRFFFEASGVQCRNCHKIKDKGAEVGPDLSQIGKKYDRRRLLDTILNPSKEVEPKYRVYLVQTVSGQVHSGLLVSRDAEQLVLKDAKNKVTTIPADEVEDMVAQQQSIMPDLLLRDMTAQQVADLTAFLSSLK